MESKGSTLAVFNLTVAALLVLLAAGWSLVQKGCHSYFQQEATSLFQKIEQGEIRYRNVNNRYLPFGLQESSKALKELRIDPAEARYFNYSVETIDNRGFRIVAHTKPEWLKRWYLHNPQSRFRLIYEKREGEKGTLIP
jgi:hypothetical protein